MNRLQQPLPSWVLPAALAVGLLALVFLGWRIWISTEGPVGPPKAVHSGMYDLRQEIAKMRASQARSGERKRR